MNEQRGCGMCVCVCIYIYIHTHTYVCVVEYYSAMKRNEIGSLAVMWMDLEDVIQSEVSQNGKIKYYILTHIWHLEKCHR